MSKIYPGEPPVTALRGVSFAVAPGRTAGDRRPVGFWQVHVAAPDGHVLICQFTTGSVRITGLEVTTMTDRELAALRATRIGFASSSSSWPSTKVWSTMWLTGSSTPGSPSANDERKPLTPSAVGLAGRLHARPTQIVRRATPASRHRPSDSRPTGHRARRQPTGNLDQATGQSILALFHERHDSGVTIVVITHDRGIAERMSRHRTCLTVASSPTLSQER